VVFSVELRFPLPNSVLKSRLIADWSVENMNPYMTPKRTQLDVRVS